MDFEILESTGMTLDTVFAENMGVEICMEEREIERRIVHNCMSSSDEEFVWTNTSNDDSESEVEMPDDGESESGKSYKKKLQKQLFQNGDLDSSAEAEESHRKRKKKHKRESSSPGPAPRRGHSAAEHILRMKVKEERVSFVEPRESPRKRRASSGSAEPDRSPRKKKKKREKEEPDSCPSEGPDEPRKRRKRKRDSERSSGGDRAPVIDKFEAEETVVERRPAVNGRAHTEEAEHRPRQYPSREFVDDDSSGDERRAPREARVSDRITFESQSDSEKEKPGEKSRASIERARDAAASRAEVAPGGKTSAEGLANGKRPTISERITFEESQSETEPPAPARRISERITFEESPSDSEPEGPRAGAGAGAGAGARLQRFLRAHPLLRPLAGPAAAAAAAAGAGVDADDEVWLVRAPADLPAAALRGLALPVDARSKLKVGGRAFEAAPAPAAERVALLCAGAGGGAPCVRALAVRGALRLRPRLPRARAPPGPEDAAPERVAPPATRARHPLLGAQWEQAAELPPAVRRRLRAARDTAPDEPGAPADDPTEPREKKKKKKKHRSRPEPDHEPEPDREPEPAEAGEEPRRRERKRDSRPEPAAPPPRKKSKKEKTAAGLRRDDPAVWDSERAIEESLFDF